MNNIKSNNIIESLRKMKYTTYTFPTDSEAVEFCRDNHISTGNIEFDGEYYTVDVRSEDNSSISDKKDNKKKKPMTEYSVSFTLIDRGDTAYHQSDTVSAYSSKQACAYLEKMYRKKGYILRDFKVDSSKVLDDAGFIDRR